MVSFLTTAVCVYVLLLIGGCVWQRSLLYFPTRFSLEQAEMLAPQTGMAAWKNSSGEVIGWKIPASGAATGSVLIVHGNAGCALQRGYFAQPIHQASDLDVYVMEYPGYGARDGTPTMTSWLAAGEEAFALLPEDRAIYLVSESLGAGVAAHLAKQHPREVSGLVMFVPYDSLASLAQSKMPWLFPYFFLRDRYEPAEWLSDYRGPLKVVVAEWDEIIPPKFGQRLHNSYAGPKSLEIIRGANHNDVAAQSPEWWREVLEFWQQEAGNEK